MNNQRGIIMLRFLAVVSLGAIIGICVVAGLAQAEAGNGCTYPYTKLAHKASGSGSTYCKIDHCVASGKRSTTYTIEANPPFLPVPNGSYVAEWGGNTAFPACSADVNNGPWE